jgi:hypothetical protein
MSRGLGRLQRQVLQACEYLLEHPDADVLARQFPWMYTDADGHHYPDFQVLTRQAIRAQVVRHIPGGICENPQCFFQVVSPYWKGPHRPHEDYFVLGSGFEESFSRAFHTLIARGHLVPVAYDAPLTMRTSGADVDLITALRATMKPAEFVPRVGGTHRVQAVILAQR